MRKAHSIWKAAFRGGGAPVPTAIAREGQTSQPLGPFQRKEDVASAGRSFFIGAEACGAAGARHGCPCRRPAEEKIVEVALAQS